jgi:hypothetical protein
VNLLRPRAAAAAAGALLAFAASACSWSVPADPGRNALVRSRPRAAPEAAPHVPGEARPMVADDGTHALYVARCGVCHVAYDPRSVSAEEWPGVVRRMAPRAGLFGAERDRLLAWLQANAR